MVPVTPSGGSTAGSAPGRRRRREASSVGERRIGNLSILAPAAPPPASTLAHCLEALRQSWQRSGNLAGLWQRWPQLAGPQLAPHCRPLRLAGSVLTVGAEPGPWLQALQYNRHQLLASLRAAGFAVRSIRFEQHHPGPAVPQASLGEADAWARHPSRVDVHGMANCPRCRCPAPAGEMARWGHCSFCRRGILDSQASGDPIAGGQ
jgi:predicted nucleic acid-binding Zn ribbon protein